VIYHDHHFQRQCHQERVANMRTDFRRAQPASRDDSHSSATSVAQQIQSIWRRVRAQASQHAPAFRS
jgi:hypothetical protein